LFNEPIYWISSMHRDSIISSGIADVFFFFLFLSFINLSTCLYINVCDDRTWNNFYILTLFYRWEREKEKRETERKKSTRANINCEENCKKKWWQFFYIYIQCNGVTSIEKNLGRRQRCSFLFFLVSVVGAVMYLTHEREYLCSSLFFSSSCADEMKKKERNNIR